ncbi:response regulator (plasmid) [Coraliomargarita sp. W4R53]
MRVIIAEDEVLLLEGLRHVIEGGGHEVVAAVGNAAQLERDVARNSPDLVVTDIRMPPTHTDEGLVAALNIRRAFPGMPVVVLSQHVQRRYAIELLNQNRGGFGYLLKQRIADVTTFRSDLCRVGAGGTALDPEVVSVLVARASRSGSAVSRLTKRQVEVLGLMAEGRSNASIASSLFLSGKAVVQHTSNIYDALELAVDSDDHRRVLAVVRFLTEAGSPQ